MTSNEINLRVPSAKDIVAIIAKRHGKDVFVTECKDGPSQIGSHVRMDAWAMRRSWANPCVTAYEAKVSRSDFLKDDKWPSYLPCCNVFYFVSPNGVIKPEEVSPSAGLLWVASTGKSLITKKKAPYRELTIPESVYRYILMCRVNITREPTITDGENGADYWRRWLNEKDEHRHLGWQVSAAIRTRVDLLERENKQLREKQSDYDDVRAMLREIGFTEPDKDWVSRHSVQNRIRDLTEIVPPWFTQYLKRLEEGCVSIRSEIERHANGANGS